MKVLCLLDTAVKPGHRWLWKYLPDNDDELEFLVAANADDRFQKWGKLASYYPRYWQLGARAWLKTRKEHYDVVVAWEGKNGFPYAVLRSLTRQAAPPLVIAGFNIRGVIGHFLGLARFGLRSVARVIVFTPSEVQDYQQRLGLAPQTICYRPHGWYDDMEWYDPKFVKNPEALARAGEFVLTSGRSYRDYGTLARAVAGTELRVKVSGRPFNLSGVALPENMEALGWLGYRELQDYLFGSRFYIVPLQPIAHAGGDSSLLHAMSFGKAIVATRAPSTETYIQDGETGLLVDPGDADGLRQAMLRLWRNPDEAARMGQAARRRFLQNHTIRHLAQRIHGVAVEAAHVAAG